MALSTFITMAPISAITGLGCIFLLVIFINNRMVNSATFHWAGSQKLAAVSAPGRVQRKGRYRRLPWDAGLAIEAQAGIQPPRLLPTRRPRLFGRQEASGMAACPVGRAHCSQEAYLHAAQRVPQRETPSQRTTLLSPRHRSVWAASPR